MRVLLTLILTFIGQPEPAAKFYNYIDQPYITDIPVESRWISFENPTGAKGKGGMTPSGLGIGRKGSPCKIISPGETVTLCDIKGPGIIHRIWMTTQNTNVNLLGLVVRGYWEDQDHPSIVSPIGNFFGCSHGISSPYQSAAHTVSSAAGLSIFLPMPFSSKARFTLSNEGLQRCHVYYEINYTLNDALPKRFGRLHAFYRRENPTTETKDFEILPQRDNQGRFVGCVLGIRPLNDQNWYGEGEVKIYIDDDEFPTFVGTGTEDYIGQSWGFYDLKYLYGGVNLIAEGHKLISIYRWHLKDPVLWHKNCRVTIQQIGCNEKGYYERSDDWSTCAFWYEPTPSEPLPPLQQFKDRIAGLSVNSECIFDENDYIKEWLSLGLFTDEENKLFNVKLIPSGIQFCYGTTTAGKEWKLLRSKRYTVDLNTIYTHKGNVITYNLAYIWAPKQMTVPLWLAADDGYKAFLNGTDLVNAGNIWRLYKKDETKCDVMLNKGWNSLLIKNRRSAVPWVAFSWVFSAAIPNAERLGIKFSTNPKL